MIEDFERVALLDQIYLGENEINLTTIIFEKLENEIIPNFNIYELIQLG